LKQIVSQLAAVLTYKRQTAVFSACVGCQVGLDVVGCFQVAPIERAEFAHTVKRKITGDVCQKSRLGVILDHDSSGTLQLRQVIQDGRAGGEAKVVDEIYCLLFAEVAFEVMGVYCERWENVVVIATQTARFKRVDDGWAKICRQKHPADTMVA